MLRMARVGTLFAWTEIISGHVACIRTRNQKVAHALHWLTKHGNCVKKRRRFAGSVAKGTRLQKCRSPSLYTRCCKLSILKVPLGFAAFSGLGQHPLPHMPPRALSSATYECMKTYSTPLEAHTRPFALSECNSPMMQHHSHVLQPSVLSECTSPMIEHHSHVLLPSMVQSWFNACHVACKVFKVKHVSAVTAKGMSHLHVLFP